MSKKNTAVSVTISVFIILFALCFFLASYRRPFRQTVEKSGVSPSLVYAVMKAESGFCENALSGAGAIGLMQLLPSTAEFICRKEGIVFKAERLYDGEYNVTLGCKYLAYLLNRFSAEETALAAYNAGEGTVFDWLSDSKYSTDGVTLKEIPYPETAQYVKKVEKFRKIYEFLYR